MQCALTLVYVPCKEGSLGHCPHFKNV
jgi:hypothetical protein